MSLLKNSVLSKKDKSSACATAGDGAAKAVRYVRPSYRVGNTDSGYVVTVDLPGVNKEGLDVVLDDGVLEVVGQRAWSRPSEWKRASGIDEFAYSLKLELSDDVDTGNIGAKIENGVLNITLSKKEEKLPRKIAIA